jgi:secreted PhoX family phosphatase
MDRPEWIDTFPDTLTAIATLTNNSSRGVAGTNSRTGLLNDPVDAINPRARNSYDHIVQWYYRYDFTEPTFRWNIFALAGDPDPGNPVPDDGSTIEGDKHGSPDGLSVARSRLWIQTDVSSSTIDTGAYAGLAARSAAKDDGGTSVTERRYCKINDLRRRCCAAAAISLDCAPSLPPRSPVCARGS